MRRQPISSTVLTGEAPRPVISPLLGLFIGVLAVSTGAIIVRFAGQAGVASLAIAAWRMTFATLILAAPAWLRARGELGSLTRREVGLGVLSGVFLAGHFATWISSLSYTSVASSVALVSLYPLFAALFSTVWLRERLPSVVWSGVLVAVVGSALVAFGDASGGSPGANPLLGDALALAGAATGAGYFLLGRRLRVKLSLLAYVTLTYGTSAVGLVLLALAARVPLLGYSPQAYLLCLLLAIVPQLIGHTSFNWALRYLSATFVTVTVVGEPIGAALLALFVFAERPGWLTISGAALILVGIVLVSRGEKG